MENQGQNNINISITESIKDYRRVWIGNWFAEEMVNQGVERVGTDVFQSYLNNFEEGLGNDVKDAFQALLKVAKSERLQFVINCKCPKCGNIFEFKAKHGVVAISMVCKCGTNLTADDLFPYFEINPVFKQFVLSSKKNSKKKRL